ncbi:MAG: hypothetical protein IJC47_04440, partial [Alistipes sp.]|nr:hypothetical protein [Alistipes sp.]
MKVEVIDKIPVGNVKAERKEVKVPIAATPFLVGSKEAQKELTEFLADTVQAEADRKEAEQIRNASEQSRVAAETTRRENEEIRISDEVARVLAEDKRKVAEQERVAAEESREERMNRTYAYSRVINGSVMQFFHSEEKASLYDEDPELYHDNLLAEHPVGGGGSGSGGSAGGYTVRLVNNMSGRTFYASKGSPVNLQFTFTSVQSIDDSEEATGERGVLQV